MWQVVFLNRRYGDLALDFPMGGQKQTLKDKPHMASWLQACAPRRSVTTGHGLHLDLRTTPKPSNEDSLA